ncbi:MAG: single-stranded-DNA-specific exonuclease RecJ [Proteobacteria bacterium]|nr:single-stranded-DNA-specific exonuclease RecJ [Pseudomonadota bacterium]
MINSVQHSVFSIQGNNSKEEIEIARSIQEGLGVPALFARILVSRGMESPEEAEAFLYPKLDNLSDPFLLPDIEKGVSRTIKAIEKMEHICIYGDYDADGITSAALMTNFFRHLGLSAEVYLPMRKEGYGLNIEAVKRIEARGTKLLICVDCGSSNVDEIKAANELGMDVIVIDHHEVPAIVPAAYALINPKRKDSRFPTRELAACGVTFFFLWALRRVMHNDGLLKDKINLKRELDIVALGTVGDMAPLIKDNRILVKFGMDAMKKRPRLWLKSFLRKGLIPRKGIDEYALNFIIIPRINATGRVSDPKKSLDFLICEDEGKSESLLLNIIQANQDRQEEGKKTLEDALNIVNRNNHADKCSIVLYKENWPIGTIGIVAQKLAESFQKPSIIITKVNGQWKGSGRSANNINLHEAISSVAHLLLKFGGHKNACGISIIEDNIEPFKNEFETCVGQCLEKTKRELHFDVYAEFEEITENFVRQLDKLSPFGVGNPRPLISLSPISVSKNNKDNKYKRIVKILDKNGRGWDGVVFEKNIVIPDRVLSIIASPFIKKQGELEFIDLNIKEFISESL